MMIDSYVLMALQVPKNGQRPHKPEARNAKNTRKPRGLFCTPSVATQIAPRPG